MDEIPDCEEDNIEGVFNRATDFVTKNASVMQQDDILYLYGRYKIANCGPCNEPMPGILKFRSRTKWTSWHDLGEMSKDDAMKQYVEKVSQIVPDWDSADPKDKKSKSHFGPVTSSCLKTDPELKHESKTVFDFVKECNLEQIKLILASNPACKDIIDETGLSLLHWACDRGYSDIAGFLISCGADMNLQDRDGQTPLHYASSCGHEEVIRLLLKKGASIDVYDADGLSPADVAFSTSVKELLSSNPV